MLLIDRKMPKSCIDCVCNSDDYWCNMTGDKLDYDIAWTGRMPNCPLKEEERKTGKWIDYAEDGYVECPFCHSATNCDGNIEELHFCFSCGAMMEGEQP